MERNLLAQWCRLWTASLVASGVRDVVVCPGSRSTPFVLALQQQPGIRLHLNIDERSAAFFALGQAKVSGVPSCVVCTSGSAAAHFYPAIIEADRSQTPLLLVSADRPAELQGNAAPQTIDQSHLFGNKVRAFFDLGAPDASEQALLGLQRKASQAVAFTQYPVAGAVHVNAPARKPLEPIAPGTPAEFDLVARVDARIAHGPTRHFAAHRLVADEALADVLRRAQRALRPVVAVGPLPPRGNLERSLAAFCERTHWPVCAELTSQLRSSPLSVCSAFEAVVARAPDWQPDFVLHLGAPLTSGPWQTLLTRAAPELVVVNDEDWPDPTNQASCVVRGDAADLLTRLAPRLAAVSAAWSSGFCRLDARARQTIDRVVADLPSTPFNEVEAICALGAALKPGDLLVLGNSLPVRLADLVLSRLPGVAVLSQRGANGIDGLVSLAGGAASVHPGRTYLLVGDVSALHDLGGLGALQRARAPLTVLVLNNAGGRIFETLPIAQHEPLDAWTTPHTVSLQAAGSLFGLPSYAGRSAAELAQILAETASAAGTVWIEAVVDPSGAQKLYAALNAAFAAEPLSAAPN